MIGATLRESLPQEVTTGSDASPLNTISTLVLCTLQTMHISRAIYTFVCLPHKSRGKNCSCLSLESVSSTEFGT